MYLHVFAAILAAIFNRWILVLPTQKNEIFKQEVLFLRFRKKTISVWTNYILDVFQYNENGKFYKLFRLVCFYLLKNV